MWRTTNRVSEGLIFLRRSSSLRLTLPSPLAHSARRADETFSTSLKKEKKRSIWRGERGIDNLVEKGRFDGFRVRHTIKMKGNDKEKGQEVGQKRRFVVDGLWNWSCAKKKVGENCGWWWSSTVDEEQCGGYISFGSRKMLECRSCPTRQ